MENKTRTIIAITVIITFCIVTGLLIAIPYYNQVSGFTGTDDIKTVYLDKVVSVFSGIIGVIIGYYFRGTSTSN